MKMRVTRYKVDDGQIRQILEAAIFAADVPVDRQTLLTLFDPGVLDQNTLKQHLEVLEADCAERGIELKEVASGYRFQVKQTLGSWVSRLWQERPQRYSRAILETLALVAYRQPITRGEIEEVRGVSVSSQIIKTLLERNWIRVVGHRDVPGRPALFATTRQFLDYFGLTSLEQLPPLAEIRDLDEINQELALEDVPEGMTETGLVVESPDATGAAAAYPSDDIHHQEDAEEEDFSKVDAILADFDSQFRRHDPARQTASVDGVISDVDAGQQSEHE
jgi:segregation and condensation protein B